MKYLLAIVSFLYYCQNVIKCQQNSTSNTVKIDVYYETLCPDSIQFIRQKLYPTFGKIGEIMDINLIPYGKAEHTQYREDVEIYCHHGSKECEGNTIQSCAIKYLDNNMTVVLPYVNCMENRFYGRYRPHISTIANECAITHGINYTQIQNCSSSLEGKRLHIKNGERTQRLSPKLTFVPWVVINNAFTETDQNIALYGDFKTLICDKYQGTTPPNNCNS